ncbi:predicted protein [Nematostella vectensis]|uniref:Transcription factor TFIIIC triple barrel domain-containing protein n=1 Tax=Nematostella vectensis TaxID=45351 RepID=A7T0P5_NEMVE|nr:predicted protein [Nematostella vectensis]|eukprot:XP_001622565.1 predicted protein [Nematostella vectensis]
MEQDGEWEEEQLVLIELSGILNYDVLYNAETQHCRLMGIDTIEPVLQIGPYTFVGHYEDVIGTNVFFEEKEQDGSKTYSYKGCSAKTLKMNRAFLKKKEKEEKTPKEGLLHEGEDKQMDVEITEITQAVQTGDT